MKLSDSIWACRSGDGTTLQDRVGNVEPTCMPITDVVAFRNVWEQRLDDAKDGNLPELFNKAQAVLLFISKHQEIVLLLWPAAKITALFSSECDEALLLD
jgi:hypothetical protein